MPNAQNVEELMKRLISEDIQRLHSLFGSLSFHRKFLRDMAERMRPITYLVKQGVKFVLLLPWKPLCGNVSPRVPRRPVSHQHIDVYRSGSFVIYRLCIIDHPWLTDKIL